MISAFDVLGLAPSDAIERLDVRPSEILREVIEDVAYDSALGRGLSVLSRDNRVFAVQLQIPDGKVERQGASLPHGLRFSMGRPEAIALLGEPEAHGEAKNLPILGKKPGWDVFRIGQNKVHVEYEFDCKSIRMVTLT